MNFLDAVNGQNVAGRLARELVGAMRGADRDRQRIALGARNEVGRLVVNTTAKVTGKILTPDDQGRLAEETNRQLAAN